MVSSEPLELNEKKVRLVPFSEPKIGGRVLHNPPQAIRMFQSSDLMESQYYWDLTRVAIAASKACAANDHVRRMRRSSRPRQAA